jgi:glycosyltransferase involved in cell wall biosynthesis
LKGIDILLDSLQALRFPWNLTIAGSELQTFATYAAQLRRQSAILENPKCQVNFAGWLSPEAIRNLLTHTDFFILPSRSEACPISLLEAMASERVCIATNVGDVAKILGPSGCGFLVPSNSSADLTVALVQAFSLGNIERQAMGRRARAKIIADYSLEAMVNRHLEIYMRLTDKIGK